MSAYTAYQLAQPQQSLLDSMTTRGFGTAVDTTAKKKGIMDTFYFLKLYTEEGSILGRAIVFEELF